MSEKAIRSKRPASVSLLLFFIIVLCLIVCSRIYQMASLYSYQAGLALLYLAFLSGTCVSILKRLRVGRILGLLCISLILVGVVYLIFNEPDYSARPELLQPTNAAERGGNFLARLVMIPLIGVWFYRFGFSRKAKAYFGMTSNQG